MTIETYRFGRLVVDGHSYTTDLLLWDGTVQSHWRRVAGHRLVLEDIAPALDQARPEIVLVGTGAMGLMKVDPGLVAALSGRRIHLEALPTGKAVDRFNGLASEGRRVLGAFHLTC